MHTKPKRQIQEQRLLQEKFAVHRQHDPRPIWLFSNPIQHPHYKLTASEMTNDAVRQHFEEIWCGSKPCTLHDQFYCKMESTIPNYPSSFRIDGCTGKILHNKYLVFSLCSGGLISDADAEEIIQEYLGWIDLSTKLPRIPSHIKKMRYTIEVMLKEACVFVLREKRKCTRDQAETFLIDNQDHSFALERGQVFFIFKNQL